jgi:hypothetical protein
MYYCGQKKWDIKFLSFEKFDVVQALLSFFLDTILADSLKMYRVIKKDCLSWQYN